MSDDQLDPAIVTEWLTAMADYVARNRVARLVYTHPWGFDEMHEPLMAFLGHVRELERAGLFRFYSMPQMTTFLNARRRVRWHVGRAGNGMQVLDASTEGTLDRQTWIFPASSGGSFRVLQGKIRIHNAGDRWLLTAGDCNSIQVEFSP